jgi:hypothetical protein
MGLSFCARLFVIWGLGESGSGEGGRERERERERGRERDGQTAREKRERERERERERGLHVRLLFARESVIDCEHAARQCKLSDVRMMPSAI